MCVVLFFPSSKFYLTRFYYKVYNEVTLSTLNITFKDFIFFINVIEAGEIQGECSELNMDPTVFKMSCIDQIFVTPSILPLYI